MKPLVSIIMGIYNCAGTLPESIDSILAQTFSDWELILCDDGSADDTYAVAQRYAATDPERIRLLKNEKTWGSTSPSTAASGKRGGRLSPVRMGTTFPCPTACRRRWIFWKRTPNTPL